MRARTQTDYGPRLKEEHVDDRGPGINVEILWVGITAPGPTSTNTNSQQTVNEQNKAALRGLKGLGHCD